MQHDVESVGGAGVPCGSKLRNQVVEAIVANLGWRTHGV
jgi:hypothetical protein